MFHDAATIIRVDKGEIPTPRRSRIARFGTADFPSNFKLFWYIPTLIQTKRGMTNKPYPTRNYVQGHRNIHIYHQVSPDWAPIAVSGPFCKVWRS